MNIFEAITNYAKRDVSNFDMSNEWIGSIPDFGSLNCIYGKTVIASDTWKTQHSVLCKLPPLTAPAFTKIKGIINTYYCSYASVWKHWNSFISNKPSDQYLTRNQLAAFNGQYVEPFVNMQWIWLLARIAYGKFIFGSIEVSNNIAEIRLTISNDVIAGSFNYLSWFISNGYRAVQFQTITPTTPFEIKLDFHLNDKYTISNETQLNEFSQKLGFANWKSYMYYCCQKSLQNLINHGIPCYELVRGTYQGLHDMNLNLLPFIAESSIWHNFYRDNQNQSPEPSYFEVNGSLYPFAFNDFQLANSYEVRNNIKYGWMLKLVDTPVNTSSANTGYKSIINGAQAFSLLTGFLLDGFLPDTYTNQVNTSFIQLSYYNGLLQLKYRNFEKDYFTSASVDPLMGGYSIHTPNTIDALRTASKLEEFLERSASARDFYNFMKYNFGTNPESTRYDKPLLLGTEVIPIQIGEQLQTSESTQSSPLGERAGVAEGFGSAGTADHYFNEHGWICSFLSFVVDSQYMQGLDISDYLHHLQLDYPFPDFANLGAEPIMKSEIYLSTYNALSLDQTSVNVDADHTIISQFVPTLPDLASYNQNLTFGKQDIEIDNDVVVVDDTVLQNVNPQQFQNRVFGYTPRYTRWKFARDVVAGEMVNSLEFWHTFRHFHQEPVIGSSFVSYRDAGWLSDLNRIFAVENDNADKYYLFIQNHCSVRRCLPLVPNTQLN